MNRMEQGFGPERSIEAEQQAFVEAFNNGIIEEIDTEFDAQSLDSLVSELQTKKLFLLGEMHGVKENVDIIYTLMKRFGIRNLALEWNKGLQQMAERFLQTGELDFQRIQNSADGRITAGHFKLLKKLKDEGLLEKLVCFDEETPSGEWDARDAKMAKNILANISDNPTLVVAGNLHTETKPIIFDDEVTTHHPLGEIVKKEIPGIPSGKIKYHSGKFHNFGIKEFEKSPGPGPQIAKFHKASDGTYFFELSKAHAAIVPNPGETE